MNKIKLLVKKWFFKVLLVLILIISISLNLKQCNTNDINQNNIIALTDTITTTKNKLGTIVKSKSLLILSINELKKINSDLINNINNLSTKDKKSLVEINKLVLTIDILEDSIAKLQPSDIIIINDSTKTYYFNKTNIFRDLRWNVDIINKQDGTLVTSNIKYDKIFMDLIITKKKEDDKLILSASSSNPYVNVTNIEGSIIDINAYNSYQKSKPFGIGIQAGYGLSTNNGVVFLSPYIGLGISYNIIKF